MELTTATLVMVTDKPVKESGTYLRGFIGNKYRERLLLHHHLEKACLYQYPKVQYKVFDGTPIILGLCEGSDELKKIAFDFDKLTLNSNRYKVVKRQFIEGKQSFGSLLKPKNYQFLTPWIALNEENYSKYSKMNSKEQTLLLHKILIGNILSAAKSFDYVVLEEIFVKTEVKPVPIVYKGFSMIGFLGRFTVNFDLPEYIGLGKGVSQGFGTVKTVV